jgi:hypothetical protein
LFCVDVRRLRTRLLHTVFSARLNRCRRDGRLVMRLLLRFLLPQLFRRRSFGTRFELVDAALLLGERCGCRRLVLARTIAAIAIATAAIAPSTSMLLALALGLLDWQRFACHRRLLLLVRRTRLLWLLSLLAVLRLALLLLTAIGTWTAVAIRPPILPLALTFAMTVARLAVAARALLEATVLLAIAAAPGVAVLVAIAAAAVPALVAPLMVASAIALLLLVLLRRRWCRGCRCCGRGLEEAK